jgi:tetratricopeptide (TPR) repeat protein
MPDPSKIGPYEILGLLGSGGMGVVYRARNLKSGEPAALKTVRVPHESLLQGIRREIHALARMEHPGIVRILDEGLHEGLPWYAMELLEGTTLRRHWSRVSPGPGAERAGAEPVAPVSAATAQTGTSRWWTEATGLTGSTIEPLTARTAATGFDSQPRRAAETRGVGGPLRVARQGSEGRRPAAAAGELRRALSLVRQLCSPLAYLHGEGMVHRDLKPDNVLLRLDGVPVLVDFGLTSRFSAELSRETLELGDSVAGTAAYIAPEQVRGELVDARADLYALGCILYELVTGRPPFLGKSGDVMARHLEAEPIRPSELVDGVVPDLDALILRLLAKRPQARFGYAADVASALAALGAEDSLSAAGPKPRSYLYRPRFAGRADALSQLEQSLAALEHGQGGLVLLGGESGVGKTRLAMELGRRAQRSGVTVLPGECLPPSAAADGSGARAGAPLQALRQPLQALADRCRVLGLEETERLLGSRGKLLALYEPGLVGLPGQDAYPEPVELPAEAARLRLFSYLAESLEALAQSSLVLLLLDDLQWADELTLGFVDFLVRTERLRSARLLVLGTFRTEERTEELGRLERAAGTVALRLSRLGEQAVGAMVSDMLALTAPPELFVRFLTRHSEGNPFFVGEYLRTVVAERLLWRDEDGFWHVAVEGDEPGEQRYDDLPLPRSLRELVGRRLEGLSPQAREMVEFAAVLGRELDEALLGELAAEAVPGDQLEPVRELLTRQVLEALEGGRLRFAHDKLREVAYQRLEPERRRALHRSAAEALESRAAERPEELFSALGQHWEQAGEAARARPYYLGAARAAAAHHVLDDAERLYQAYLRLLETPDAESIAARNELGRKVLVVQGRSLEAVFSNFRQALEEARRIGDHRGEAMSLLNIIELISEQGRLDEAWALSEESLGISTTLDDAELVVRALNGKAEIQLSRGQLDEAESLLYQSLSVARMSELQLMQDVVLGKLARVGYLRGNMAEAQRLLETAIQRLERTGDLHGVAAHAANLAAVLQMQGQFGASRKPLEQALAISRQVGDRPAEAIALANLGEVYAHYGQFEQAQRCYEQAILIQRLAGKRKNESINLVNLASMHLAQGQPQQARRLLEQGLAIAEQIETPWYKAQVLREMGVLERRTGDVLDAATHVRQAELLHSAVGDGLSVGQCICEHGHVLLAQEQPARDALERARGIASKVRAAADSPLERDIAKLRRAVEGFEAGHPLHRGECVEDLPEGLRRWLADAGRLLPT